MSNFEHNTKQLKLISNFITQKPSNQIKQKIQMICKKLGFYHRCIQGHARGNHPNIAFVIENFRKSPLGLAEDSFLWEKFSVMFKSIIELNLVVIN